jgi:hypothetical protein
MQIRKQYSECPTVDKRFGGLILRDAVVWESRHGYGLGI